MNFENRIFLATIPKRDLLCYFLGKIDFKEKNNEDFPSNFNWQKIKTRQIIDKCEDVLAAPVEGNIYKIHIITSENFFNEKNFKLFEEKHGLSLSGPHPLQNEIYLECIFHSLALRISSEWNQIRNYFLKSQNFLNSQEAVESLQVQLIITDGCIAFSTWAMRLKLPLLSLIDLEVDIKAFYEKGFATVNQKVYILPFLKPAIAIKVHLNIPNSCPLKTFEDIRSYWKILYGYNLPTEEEMLYVEVIFSWSSSIYTYPIMCICSFEPIQFKCRNELQIIHQFSKTLSKKFTNICGYPIHLNVKNENTFHSVSKLYLASEIVQTPNLMSLTDDGSFVKNRYKGISNNSGETLATPVNKTEHYHKSSPMFLSTFQQIPPLTSFKTEETFKCVAKYKPIKMISSTVEKKFIRKSPSPQILQHKQQCSSTRTITKKDVISHQDMLYLTRSKNLEKLKVSVLMNFCKENQIRVKSKDNKKILIQKIEQFFQFSK